MNLRDLNYLIALKEHGHFGRAAQSCFVSQPSLSGQIAKLEETLGLQLIDRSRRKVRFTAAGLAIVERARLVSQEVEALLSEARRWQEPMSGELRIGLIPTVAPYLLPLIVAPLQHAFPSLSLTLFEGQTAHLLEKLERGELDCLLLAYLEEMSGYACETLYREPMVLALPVGHPLCEKGRVCAAELKGMSLLMLEDGHCLRDQALGYCFAAGANEDGSFRATSLETLRHMVAAGRGVTLLPELAVEGREHNNPSIVYLPFEAPPPSRDIALIWRRGAGLDRTCRPLAVKINDSIKHRV